MARRVLMADISGMLIRGRLRLGWVNGTKVAFHNRGMRWRWPDNARKIGRSGEPWSLR